MRKIAIVTVLYLGTSFARANVTGSDIQNFNPTTNGLDFVTVQSSETLKPGVINFGYFLNYAVNTMPNYVNQTTQRRTDFEDSMLGGDINIGLGLSENWDIGFSAPQVYSQKSESNDVPSGRVTQTGVVEYRINSKYRFFGDENGGLAFVGTVNFNQVEDNPFVGTEPGPTYNFELAWDTSHNDVSYGVNVGYRQRNPGDALPNVPVEPFDDQLVASVAASYRLEKIDTKLIGEIFSSFPIEKPETTTDRDLSSMELLLGVKKDIRHDLALHAGAGTELYHGSSSPDWRIYAGLNWNMGPLWRRKASESDTLSLGAMGQTKPRFAGDKFIADDILFEFNSFELSEGFKNTLNELAKYLASGGFKKLIVEGHTDSVGPEEYNLYLSQQRVNSVVKYLTTEAKLDPNKVSGVGYGESKPIADNSNYQGRQTNRRVEFNISR